MRNTTTEINKPTESTQANGISERGKEKAKEFMNERN